jgi:uncharacterized membrane protein
MFASVNPFDPRTAFFARHAQHVVLIHFPIALFITGVACDAAAQWTRRQQLVVVAGYNLVIAALFTIPVIVTGLAAWQWALEGQKLKGILLMHLVSALISSVLMWFIAWLHFRARTRPKYLLPGYRIPLEFLAVALVALTGHLGGFLSGVNGPG